MSIVMPISLPFPCAPSSLPMPQEAALIMSILVERQATPGLWGGLPGLEPSVAPHSECNSPLFLCVCTGAQLNQVSPFPNVARFQHLENMVPLPSGHWLWTRSALQLSSAFPVGLVLISLAASRISSSVLRSYSSSVQTWISLDVSYLRFAQLLESVNFCLSPNLGSFSRHFFECSFQLLALAAHLLGLWLCEQCNSHCIPQAPEPLFSCLFPQCCCCYCCCCYSAEYFLWTHRQPHWDVLCHLWPLMSCSASVSFQGFCIVL